MLTSHAGPRCSITPEISSKLTCAVTAAYDECIPYNYEHIHLFKHVQAWHKDLNMFDYIIHKYIKNPALSLSRSVTCVCLNVCVWYANPWKLSSARMRADTKRSHLFRRSVSTRDAFSRWEWFAQGHSNSSRLPAILAGGTHPHLVLFFWLVVIPLLAGLPNLFSHYALKDGQISAFQQEIMAHKHTHRHTNTEEEEEEEKHLQILEGQHRCMHVPMRFSKIVCDGS